jgi:hypothetical protein
MTQANNKALFNQNKRAIKAALPDESVCPYCNCIMLKATNSPYSLVSLDHIKAYSKGGDDSLENLIACCANCNTKKGNNPFALFFRINTTKIIPDSEYTLLNDFVTVTQRVEYLKKIKELIIAKELLSGVTLSQEAEIKTSSNSFFAKLTLALKNNTNSDYILKEVVVRLKAELDKLTTLNEELKHISFSTYSLFPSNLSN